ncbi:PAS domain S-box protein [Paenibacillus nanensis]|uniref:histidine kinase n=2 Tax=Paenibacillus nanensis TaxID=393251 RepID=A0A3A1UNP6_9BACL|nr:PAS domain S-box protein [Paenibacillus nanensis]
MFEMYRIIAENTMDSIVVVDNDAIVRFVSPSLTEMTGYSLKEYEGMDAFNILHPDDRERVRGEHAKAVGDGCNVDTSYRIIDADGRVLFVEARVRPVLDETGHVKYVVAVARDVTERKQAERLLEQILSNTNAAVFSTDQHFSRYTFCSESMEKISGLPMNVIREHPIRLHDHIHPDDNDALMGEVKERLDQGLSVTRNFRWIHHKDEERWGRLIIHPYLNSEGSIERLDGIILDMTEKIRSDLALEESEQRYKSLFENNFDGVFSMELSGFYFVGANRSFEEIVGVEMDQLIDRCFLGILHDEDHAEVYAALVQVMQLGLSRDIECRLAQRGNAEKIVSITFVPIIVAGKLNGIHGIVKDITKRKQEERELIQSEERYKHLQQSLNRFAGDLARVMKVADLERRLLDEVGAVLRVSDASIEEVPQGEELPAAQAGEMRVKIGEKAQGMAVYLRIALNQGLQKIEEEWLDTAVHYVTILYDNLQFIEDLMQRMEAMVEGGETPRWMLRLLFSLSEKERASLSSDLHDAVLQDLIIWYRKLESLRSTTSLDHRTDQELKRIEEGLLDAIHQIRITCNELRPPFLLKMGLVESVKSLLAYARMFANYEIEFVAEEPSYTLSEDQILGLYRIVQELLNNANKHAMATKVAMELAFTEDEVRFTYSDNGVGMDLSAFGGSFQHMGIAGIEKRVLSLDGKVELTSSPNAGFHVHLRIPTNIK